MDLSHMSLRSQVAKWLAPTLAGPSRVIRSGCTPRGVRYVSIDVMRLAGPLTIAFFHYQDGTWQVFSPGTTDLR